VGDAQRETVILPERDFVNVGVQVGEMVTVWRSVREVVNVRVPVKVFVSVGEIVWVWVSTVLWVLVCEEV
jgi:hypothetical protein